MAWLYKRGGKWWIGYRHNGKQILRSTRTSDQKRAEAELQKIETLFGYHQSGALTEELYRALTSKALPVVTLAAELDGWINWAAGTTAAGTLTRYKSVADEFRAFMQATEAGPLLSNITSDDIEKFLLHKRKTVAASTANVTGKIISGFFKRAATARPPRLRDNPAKGFTRFKAQKGERVKKRSFTLAELSALYGKAPDDFWRYMIIGEFYTGLRMGDLICLRWGSVDLERGFLKVTPDKTEDKEIHIPIARPLRDILAARNQKAGKVKHADFVWPDEAQRHQSYKSGSGYFSNQFYNLILEPCGMVPKRDTSHKATKGGREAKRAMNDVSFHCLRHSFVTFLKSTGSNQAIAKELAGHSSDVISDLYTHTDEAALIKAINQLPEFVK